MVPDVAAYRSQRGSRPESPLWLNDTLLLYSTLTTKSSPGVHPVTNGCLRFDEHRILVFTGLSQIYDALDADSDGLSTEDAESRRSEHGSNRLPKTKPVTVWQIFLRQFKNPLIYILATAAIVSFAIGEETDAGFIALVLLINALVGGIQEWRAERSSQALQQLIRTRATVIRDGETRDIDGEEVVPGDIVLLESGYRVPADIRLVSTHGLEIDESPLTGESAPS